MNHFDVVIIGSGISSLTAAALLAKSGRSVCVLEQYVKPGGYLHCFNRFGNQYDTGSHYIGAMEKGQTFRTLLEYLGVFDESHFVPLDRNGFDVLQFPEFRFEVPVGYPALAERLSALFPSEREGIQELLKLFQSTVTQFPTYRFNENYDEMGLLKALNVPLNTVVESHISNPKLRAVFYAYSAIHGVAPTDISFGLHTLVMDSMLVGPYGFRKGGDALTQSFVSRISSYGGQVRTRARVSQMEVKDRKVTRVVLQTGEYLEAEWVISGIHPKATFRMVDPSLFTPAFRTRVFGMKETIPIFGIYADCHQRPSFDALQNYYFFSSVNPMDWFRFEDLAEEPPIVFVTRPDRSERDRFPLTFHSPCRYDWFHPWVETRLGKRPLEYAKAKEQAAEASLSMVGRYHSEIPACIQRYETSSPLTNLFFNGSEEGSAYGIYHSIENTGHRALGPRTHLSNLLLTGQNCLTPGLLGAAISGLRTAGSILGIKPLIKDLRLWGQPQ